MGCNELALLTRCIPRSRLAPLAMALDYWVEFFEDLQYVRGRSKNTVMAYRRDLDVFSEFLEKEKDVNLIYDFLNKKKLSLRSQARIISSIRTYYRYCMTKGMKVPELTALRPPKIKPKLPDVINVEDFEKLVESSKVEDEHKTNRNHLTLFLLFGLGCRVTELIGLNLTDFNPTDSWLSVMGKGGKQRLLPLTEKLNERIVDYIKNDRELLLKDQKSKSILINDRGKCPSRIDIWRWLDAWSKKSGFDKTVSPHQFRHGCATVLLEGGADLRSIQMLLGHSSIQSTQIYTSVTTDTIQKEVEKHHPLSKLK
ncbi:tyrosine-type recombinase/integrase [bacterium]|nr:tyrosine-type recombinase/integrase [bacterium]MDB2425961.1 tyrosine-type recombinase/integrase [bacterium]